LHILLAILGAFIQGSALRAQGDINPGMKMVMIYKFSQHVEWENEEAIDTFHIGVYGNAPDLMREMLLLESVPLKEKPISIIQFTRFRELDRTHVLYITPDRNSEIERITEKIRGNNTLLITDRHDDQNRIMINFLPLVNNKIQFEVNKANMINAKLGAMPDLLLLGGTEIDVAQLYKESQDAHQQVLRQVSRLYDSLKIQGKEIEARNREIENQNILIEHQTEAIRLKEEEINSREKELEKLTSEIQRTMQTLNSKNEQIKSQLARIAKQEEEIENRNSVLDLIQKEIENQQAKIEEQKSELTALSSLVERQRFALYAFIVFCALTLGLIFFIYRSYKIKQIANRELKSLNRKITERNKEISKQKHEIEEKNEELQTKNEEIVAQAEELQQANEEILSTNEALENQKTELQLTLENLKMTQDQLVQSEKLASVGQLTAGIAHELNNPINFISGNVNPLKRDLKDIFDLLNLYDVIVRDQKLGETFGEVETMKENMDLRFLTAEIKSLLDGIGEGAHRSSEIVKGLRSFSRLDDEKFKKADIHEGIDSTLILLHNKTKNRIKIHKDYGSLPEIECLPSKINQVFMNILTNSIQAIEGKGDIYIETISSDIGIKICIRDTGVGMTPEIKKRIFEPFYTTKEVGSGTGLGLSITYGIIEQHGGHIDVISKPGKGTEFIISLPITQNNS
jgi:signal transduction histidine kinase